MLPYMRMTEDSSEETCRKKTDVNFLYAMAIFMVLMTIGLIYSSTTANLDRITKGYDECGNICGMVNNSSSPGSASCAAELSTSTSRCDNHEHELNENLAQILLQIYIDYQNIKWQMLLVTFVSLGLIGIMIMLFRYYTKQFIYTLLGLLVVLCVFLLILAIIQMGASGGSQIGMSISTFISSFIILVILLVVYKRIPLVIRLFHEASKALGDMPCLLLQPLATLAVLVVLSALSILCSLMFASCGTYDVVEKAFIPNEFTLFSFLLFVFGFHWLVFFVLAMQDMVVGGTVANWYFTKDKSTLKKPISSAMRTTFAYHLGTLAFGSLLAVFITILKRILHAAKKRNYCCIFILERIEDILRYMSKIAYIMTIMHGVPFIDGGKRAVNLLKKNCMATLTVNTTSIFIIRLAQLLLFVIVMLGSYFLYAEAESKNALLFGAISGLIAIVISNCFFVVYDTAIDTLFLCYCEDMEANDGLEKPYYSSTVLVGLIQDSKKVEVARNLASS